MGEKMSYNQLLSSAALLYDQGRFAEAEQALRRIIQTFPDNHAVLNLLGLVAQAQGLHEPACSYFAAALRLDAAKAEYHYNLAFSAQRLQHFADAIIHYRKALELVPSLKEAHNELGAVYQAAGDLTQAHFHWQQALKLDPNYPAPAANIAYSNANFYPVQTITDLTSLSRKFPQEPLVWFYLADVYHQTQDYSSALNSALSGLALTPQDADLNYLAGLASTKLNNPSSALDYFLQAEAADPLHYNAKLAAADIFSRNDDFSQAEPRYKRLIELDGNVFAVHHNYAEMLYRQHRLPEALEEYRAAILLDPKSDKASYNLGLILREQHDYTEALGLFFNALHQAREPDYISVQIVETLVLLSREDLALAQKIAANWLKSYPDNLFARHINTTLKGENIEDNHLFNEKLFDAFADNYELVMQNLAYSAPLAVGRIAGPLQGSVLDLGCGSGLAGQAVKNSKNQIIGVDLSTKMLELARQKNIYQQLIKSDILNYLKSTQKSFDWIIAADVICYLGDLSEFISLCRNSSLIFTIEASNDINCWQIRPSGRFLHNPKYVKQLLEANSLTLVKSEKLTLRYEDGQAVEGQVFYASPMV